MKHTIKSLKGATLVYDDAANTLTAGGNAYELKEVIFDGQTASDVYHADLIKRYAVTGDIIAFGGGITAVSHADAVLVANGMDAYKATQDNTGTIALGFAAWGERTITLTADLRRADADLLADCKKVLAAESDLDKMPTDAEILAAIAEARKQTPAARREADHEGYEKEQAFEAETAKLEKLACITKWETSTEEIHPNIEGELETIVATHHEIQVNELAQHCEGVCALFKMTTYRSNYQGFRLYFDNCWYDRERFYAIRLDTDEPEWYDAKRNLAIPMRETDAAVARLVWRKYNR